MQQPLNDLQRRHENEKIQSLPFCEKEAIQHLDSKRAPNVEKINPFQMSDEEPFPEYSWLSAETHNTSTLYGSTEDWFGKETEVAQFHWGFQCCRTWLEMKLGNLRLLWDPKTISEKRFFSQKRFCPRGKLASGTKIAHGQHWEAALLAIPVPMPGCPPSGCTGRNSLGHGLGAVKSCMRSVVWKVLLSSKQVALTVQY